MPVLILEDGTGLTNSNSYTDVEEANAYFEVHPYYKDNWDELGLPDRESLLIMATANLDALMTWRGDIMYDTQSLGWPRQNVYDNEGRLLANNVVPKQVKWATAEMAFHLSRGDLYAPSATAGMERIKIDVIELQFSGSVTPVPIPAPALIALNGLGAYSLGSRVSKVLVG